MSGSAVGVDKRGFPIDKDGNIVSISHAGVAPVGAYRPGAAASAPVDDAAARKRAIPAVKVSVAFIDGISINLPAGTEVNANGTLILADGTPLNPLDVVNAWRNGKTHV